MKTIAVVEDDIHIGGLLEDLLTTDGYRVVRAYSGTEALLIAEKSKPDLMLLDLMLPGMSGEEVLKKIAGKCPVIILSAKSTVSDKVGNLLSGACDYITKPFSSEELLARITAALRRTAVPEKDISEWRDIRIDKAKHLVTVGNTVLRLTKTEFGILSLLVSNPSRVFTKSAISDKISEFSEDGGESSISVHISNLRQKLSAVTGINYIETVWGIGFKLNENF